jgi:hypothetical protein
MMGQLNHDQEQLFYSFRLEEVILYDHLILQDRCGSRFILGSF